MSSKREDVIGIICEQLDLEASEIVETNNFVDDLGADSLAIVELVLALEEKFDLKIPDNQVDNIKTVGDAIHFIENN
jgi:acyl carrier protein